jgi:hypothetical protein
MGHSSTTSLSPDSTKTKGVTILEGETVLWGEDLVPGVVIHDDGDRVQIKFFGPDVDGLRWVKTEEIRIALEGRLT